MKPLRRAGRCERLNPTQCRTIRWLISSKSLRARRAAPICSLGTFTFLTDDALTSLSDAVLDAFWNEPEKHEASRLHYLEKNRDPYLARRRKVGWDMYGLLGIGKGEHEKTREFHARNFKFFNAPVGMIFTIDRDMGWMSWLDYGMFIQNICVAARGQGLDTCPQAAWAGYHTLIEKHLGLPDVQLVHCGLSLGYEDTSAEVNKLETVREPLEDFVTFHGG